MRMGTDHAGCSRSQMEQAGGDVLHLPTSRHAGSGLRFYGAADEGVSVEWGSDMGSPTTTSSSDRRTGQASGASTHGSDYACTPDSVIIPLVYGTHVDEDAGTDRRERLDNATPYRLFILGQGDNTPPPGSPYVDLEDVDHSYWGAFVRFHQIARGVEPKLASATELVYKQGARTDQARGTHLIGPWGSFLAYLTAPGQVGKTTISDLVFCNFVAVTADGATSKKTE